MADAAPDRLRSLEQRVADLERRLARAEASLPAWQPVDAGSGPGPLGDGAGPGPARATESAGRTHAGRPAARTRNVEALLGANWLARAGILLLALGVVFFLRLGFDRGWVPIPARYGIGLAGGAALWVLGDALRGRRLDPAFAQVLAGGGAVILYVTLYVGYALPTYRAALGMTLPLALALLAAASVALGAYAVWRGQPLLGIVAAGLATVLLAPAGDLSTAGVLYAVLLDTALLLASVARRWATVASTAIVAANLPILAGFFAGDVAWPLLLACSLVANGAGVAAAAAARAGARHVLATQAGTALAFLALEAWLALDRAGSAHPAGWALLAVGAAGLAAAALLPRARPGLGTVAWGLLLAWPAAHLQDSFWTPAAMAGLALAARALAWARPALRVGAALAASAAAVAAAGAYHALAHGLDLADAHRLAAALAGAAVAGAGLASWLAELRSDVPQARVGLAVALLAALSALAAVLGSWAVTVSWAALALAAVVLGFLPRLGDLRLAAFGLFAVVLVRIFLVDLADLGVVARAVAFLATGALLLVAAFVYARGRRSQRAEPPAGPA